MGFNNTLNKNIIIITDAIYPIPSATGSVALDIIDAIIRKYNITVLGLKSYYNQALKNKINSINYVVFSTFLYDLRLYFLGKHTKFSRVAVFILRSLGRIKALLFTSRFTWFLVDKYVKYIDDVLNTNNIDVIIAFSEPFETNWAALKIKKKYPKIKFISFFCDKYPVKSNVLNIFENLSTLKNRELDVINNSDLTYITQEMYDSNKEYYSSFGKKLKIYPYIIKNIASMIENTGCNNNKISFIYAGNFYKKMREPYPMIDLLQKVHEKLSNIELYIYTSCNYYNKIRKIANEFEWLHCYGLVEKDIIYKKYLQSNFLINIENSNKDFYPSKLFEMIGTGKPILNFYFKQKNSMLEKYPLALQIDKDDIDVNVDLICKFIINNLRSRCNYDAVSKIYKEHSCEEFVNDFVDSLKKI